MAELLFGKEAPSGKLPLTFYRNDALEQMPAFTDYSMQNRTYRYYTGTPLYPFGYGLGYSKCSLELLRAGREGAELRVRNDGARAQEEVVELYLRDERSPLAPPNAVLCGFRRIRLEPGEEKTLSVPIDPLAFTVVDEQGERIPGGGTWRLYAGFGAPDARSAELSGQTSLSAVITG